MFPPATGWWSTTNTGDVVSDQIHQTHMDMGKCMVSQRTRSTRIAKAFHIYDFLWTCRDKWGYSSKSIHIPICELIATEFSRIARCLAAVRSGVVKAGRGCRVWGALGDTAGLECKNSLMLIEHQGMQTEQHNNHSKNKKHLMVVIHIYICTHTQRFMPKEWRKVPSIWQVWEANMWRSTHGTWILVAHTVLAMLAHGARFMCQPQDTGLMRQKLHHGNQWKPCRILCVKNISPIKYHGFFVETSRLLTPWWVDFHGLRNPRPPQMWHKPTGRTHPGVFSAWWDWDYRKFAVPCNPITISVIGCSMNQ